MPNLLGCGLAHRGPNEGFNRVRFLLDTCVLSVLARPQANPRVVDWLQACPAGDLGLSVVTTGEIRFGSAALPAGQRQRRLAAFYEQRFAQYAAKILPISDAISAVWAHMRAQRRALGQPLPLADGLIAATAGHHGLSLVTRNIADFAKLGIPLITPRQEAG